MLRIGALLLLALNLAGQGLEEVDTTAFSVLLEDFVITAQNAPTHYKEAIHQVDVISRKEIETRGVVTLDEALKLNSSLRLYHDPVLGKSVKMRGISSRNVAILINGVPIIGRLNGSIDLAQINMNNVDRIEIVEGALSNIYGSNAAGGVINIITKRSQLSDVSVTAGTQLESIGQQTYNAEVGIRAGKFLFNAHGQYLNYDQFPIDSLRVVEPVYSSPTDFTLQPAYPFNPKEQTGLGGFVRYDYDEETSLVLSYDFNMEDVSSYGRVRRPRYNPYAQDEFFTTERSGYSLNFKKKYRDVYIDITSAYNVYNRYSGEQRYYIESETYDSLLLSMDTTRFNTFFNRAVVSYDISDGLKSTVGMNYTLEQGSGDRIVDHESADSTTADFNEVAPFLELKYTGIKDLKLSASGRYIYHSIYREKFTPSFHAHYKVDDRWTLRGSYAQGYRNPDLKELFIEFIDVNHFIVGNQDLKPETSHDFQLGINYDHNDFQASANIYHTTIRNLIGLVEYETQKYTYDNVDRYNVIGIQPSVSFTLPGGIELKSAATYGFWASSVEADDIPEYRRVFDVNNTLNYTIPVLDVGVVLNHRHIGNEPRYFLSDGQVQVSNINSYDLIDATINRSFLKNKLKVITGVKNIFNTTRTQISGGGSGGGHSSVGRNIVSPGRSAFLGVKVSL